MEFSLDFPRILIIIVMMMTSDDLSLVRVRTAVNKQRDMKSTAGDSCISFKSIFMRRSFFYNKVFLQVNDYEPVELASQSQLHSRMNRQRFAVFTRSFIGFA
ncbi:CLUMA_CG016678, isoform A [Clunio marinus]|uniref:CLUMA_CG016678, isoform A n=1 Tax=Clunio marinus TaxID=568069 RepID=A0A1J1IVG2_9DIPT|nr:CLUMA_CG016678, isoform A [Clunio marinus]